MKVEPAEKASVRGPLSVGLIFVEDFDCALKTDSPGGSSLDLLFAGGGI